MAKTLRDLKKGQRAVVTKVGGTGALRQHFLDMGVIPGAEVVLQKFAPMGDPMELRIHGYELTLRLADAEKIEIKNPSPTSPRGRAADESATQEEKWEMPVEHPGLGEDGPRYHDPSQPHGPAQAE